jgi:hypothetical protein
MGPWLVDVEDRPSLEVWLAGGPPEHDGSTVMLVRGDGPEVRLFIPNALDAAKEGGRRVVVWFKDPALLHDDEKKHIFGKGDPALAAVLGIHGGVGGWVTRDRLRVEDAAFAFAGAEELRG